MEQRFTDDLAFILLALVVASAIGFLVAWFWRASNVSTLKHDLQKCKDKLSEGIDELDQEKEIRVQSLTVPDSREDVQLVFNTDLAKNILGKKVTENDLKVIVGIGPKIDELLTNSAISSWKELAGSTNERLLSILKEGGPRFRLHSSSTWVKQSEFAMNGKWKELKKYQDSFKAGSQTSKRSL